MALTQKLQLTSPAKINLFLHITGRRPNGYHELQTIFQLLNIGDEISIEANNTGKINLSSNFTGVIPEDNLIVKAAKALQDHSGTHCGAKIHLNKILPSGAGLGGGSSNAATTLLGLNALWELQLDTDTLAKIGCKLGADVPVFIYGKNAWAEGIGDKLTPIHLPKKCFLVIFPGVNIATEEIFRNKHLTRDTTAITLAAFLEQGGHNDCEAVVKKTHKEVDKALNLLAKYTPSKLTGTGSCIFGEFDSESEAEAVKQLLPEHWQSFVALGVELSPTYQQLGLT